MGVGREVEGRCRWGRIEWKVSRGSVREIWIKFWEIDSSMCVCVCVCVCACV